MRLLHRLISISTALILLSFFTLVYAGAAFAQAIVGVNTPNPDRLSDAQQDEMIAQLAAARVNTIRLQLINERSLTFIKKAYAHHIATVLIISPYGGASGAHIRPIVQAAELTWPNESLSDCNQWNFKRLFAAQLADLETAGVKLAAFELGNELNNAAYNGDFLPRTPGREITLEDLKNPTYPEAQAVSDGYRAYVRLTAALRNAVNESKLNSSTPIISAGLVPAGLSLLHYQRKWDYVSLSSSLKFWRFLGMNKFVDAYGVHIYPTGELNKTLDERVAVLEQLFSESKLGNKPFWLTEWGFPADQSCPIKESPQRELVQIERRAMNKFVQNGQLAAALYYCWEQPGGKYGIYRCNQLSQAGRAALNPF